MTSVRCLLDTHALLWWKAGGERLSARARTAIERADERLVCPISFWEVAMLEQRGRIALDRDAYLWAAALFEEGQITSASLAPSAAIGAGRLPASGFEGDPADALIYATAREWDVPLVSKDQRIRSHAAAARDLRVIW